MLRSFEPRSMGFLGADTEGVDCDQQPLVVAPDISDANMQETHGPWVERT